MHASSTTPPRDGGWDRVARIAFLIACCAVSASCGGAGSDPDAAAADVDRPASVPGDYLVTPQGYFHPSCVIELSDREQLRADGEVLREDGISRPVAPCGHASFDRQGLRRDKSAPPPTVNGWVASASSIATGATSYVSASWLVPSAPARRGYQTIYLFPGIEPAATYDVILQPVLAWNGFGDRRWTVASWSCCKDGNALHSAPRNVSVGDTVTGAVAGTSCDAQGLCSSWRVETSVPARGISTVLETHSYGEVLDWTFGGALEAYGVTRCDQYPASGGVEFQGVTVVDASGASVAPPWVPVRYATSPSCLLSVGATGQDKVSMTWRTTPQ